MKNASIARRRPLLDDRPSLLARSRARSRASGSAKPTDIRQGLRSIPEGPTFPAFGIADRVSFVIDGPSIQVGLDEGTPLSLLVGEVVSNACKHAFPNDRAGTIRVTIQDAGGHMTLRIADDGIGPQAGSPSSGTHMGTRLIVNFVQQLNGSSSFSVGESGGAVFELSMPTPVA
jgi:two-component sensor histidine kinase